MANAAKPLRELLADIKWLIDKGRADEPAVLYMPKIEAARRRANKEKSHRVVFVCTPETKSEFETQRDRYISLAVNKEIGFTIMCQILAAVSDDVIQGMASADQKVIDAGQSEG